MDERQHVDVLIVGAGISGIGAAYHLSRKCPDRTLMVVDGRDRLGGTWDLFRYPGIRSDSDMHTLGYSFKPWKAEKAIADGPSILEYLDETVDEFDLRQYLHFGITVTKATWDSDTARWTLTAERTTSGEPVELTCSFLFMCSGYYSYQRGHTPEFPGREDFEGTIVHPQFWPEDLDYDGKRVVVIGSGATAMTLVPAMADRAEHVTMLQRSPTYVISRPARDPIANRLRKVLPEKLAYALTRRKNVALQDWMYRRSRRDPKRVGNVLVAQVRKALGPDYDVEKHFTPRYGPWEQRLCLVPDGDLFRSLRSGAASVVTDTIERFTPDGIRLASGEELPADIIVTATGLELVTLGEMTFDVDGEEVNFADTWTYKGLAYSGVPNLVSSFGYINASWTLRADLTCDFVARVLNHLRDTGTDIVTPTLRAQDRTMTPKPWLDDFSAGYVQRVLPLLPKQGDHEPWVNVQRYATEKRLIGDQPVDDGVLRYRHAGDRAVECEGNARDDTRATPVNA